MPFLSVLSAMSPYNSFQTAKYLTSRPSGREPAKNNRLPPSDYSSDVPSGPIQPIIQSSGEASSAGVTAVETPTEYTGVEESPKNTVSSAIATPKSTRLSDYFVGDASKAYSDVEFQHISVLLKDSGRDSWSNVPRIYTVLRTIGQLQVIDAFLDQGITDIWFPFSTSSLPRALSSTLHPQFFDVQNGVLTKGLDLETNSSRKHAHFGKTEVLPFKVEKELGGGRFSQVHRITSSISKREYARKQFRRGAGTRNAAEIKSFKVELQVLKKIHHHHCVELVSSVTPLHLKKFGVILRRFQVGSYTDPKWFALIMSPVADCDLKAFYNVCKGDEQSHLSTLKTFFGCLTSALNYLHSSKIRHRDIKPQNILVKGENGRFSKDIISSPDDIVTKPCNLEFTVSVARKTPSRMSF